MKHLTIDEFVNNLPEEDLWKIILEYETNRDIEDAEFLREKAREYCDKYYYMQYMPEIALYAYRHFAMKYKESLK
jgi:hypothetical protein